MTSRNYRGTDGNTDHYLVVAKYKRGIGNSRMEKAIETMQYYNTERLIKDKDLKKTT